MSEALIIPKSVWEHMHAYVAAVAPEEACGLVSGQDSVARHVIPVENVLHSKTRFRMEPHAQIKALMEIDERGEELLAIYHSHPHGPNHPSHTDIAEATYPEAVSLIWYPHEGQWMCRGFSLDPRGWKELPIKIEDGL